MACLYKDRCTRGECAYGDFENPTIRDLRGYCPMIDTYFEDEAQEAYIKSKNIQERRRIGQQKSKRGR